MASACINNIGMSPESFLDCPPAKFPSYDWLSPGISFSREFSDEDGGSKAASGGGKAKASENAVADKEEADLEASGKDFVDFEFRLEDPVNMLPADELFSGGKLVPLHLSMVRPATVSENAASDVRSPDLHKLRRRNEISPTDPYLFSPKAPRCSSRWREMLGFKKLYNNSTKQDQQQKTTPSSSSNTHKSLKHFLHRNSKSSLSSSLDSSSLSLPLLSKDVDNESSISISSSRLSLSSSSSGHDHDDLPRLSLDSEKPTFTRTGSNQNNPPRVRVVKPRALSSENPTAVRVARSPVRRAQPETTTVDSPRMNSSGKIVFNSLERSSSSPSSLNGGPRYKLRGMERSYSANVRVTPVLNVPVCSLRGSSKSGGVFGFPLFSSSSSSLQQRKEGGGGASSGGNGAGIRGGQNNNSKNRTDRT